MQLKQKLSLSIGLILGGLFIAFIGFFSAIIVGGFPALIPSVFGVLGLLMVFVGCLSLKRRSMMAIIIDSQGIEVPIGLPNQGGIERLRITSEEIALVSKSISLRWS